MGDFPNRVTPGLSPPEAPPPRWAPHLPLPAYYGDGINRQAFVKTLFDDSAADYDRIHALMSLGSGRWYREQALRDAGLSEGMKVLDVACGTGLLATCASSLVGSSGVTVGLDASAGMLQQARRRGCGSLVQARAEQLPFPDHHFDFVSMGYALRHVSDLRIAFREYCRVLKPGGMVLILEIARPASAVLLGVTRCYLKSVVPLMARIVTGSRNSQTLMRYFWNTIEHCVPAETILSAAAAAGFEHCRQSQRLGGLIRDYTAIAPPSRLL